MVNLSSFGGGMVGGASVQIVISAVDDFSKTFKNATTSTEKLGKALKIAAIGTAGSFAYMATQAAKFERTQAAFTTMLGSAEKAKQVLGDLAEFTKQTPFQLEELETNSKLLLGMGIDVEKLIPTMKSLGDVASALNIPFDRVALNFGQVKAQGALMGTELRDFARAGIPIISELAKNLNVSEKAIKEMSSQSKISFADVEEAFRTMSGKGGQFEDFMVKAMDTTTGKISNFKDSIQQLSRVMGETFLPVINRIVGGLTDMVNKFNELTPEQKKLVSNIAVGTGSAVIAGGAAVKIAETINQFKGSVPSNPLYTWQVNGGLSNALKNVGGGAVAGGAAGGGISAVGGIIGGALMATIAASGFAQMKNDLTPGYYDEFIRSGVEMRREQLGIDIRDKSKYSNFGLKNTGFSVANKETEATNLIILQMLERGKQLINETAAERETDFSILTDIADKQFEFNNLTVTNKNDLVNYNNKQVELNLLKQQAINLGYTEGVINKVVLDYQKEKTDELYKQTQEMQKQIRLMDSEDKSAFIATAASGGTFSAGAFSLLQSAGVFSSKSTLSDSGQVEFNDFISRPGQGTSTFSPNDTIIGVKNPSALMGGFSVNIENVYGTDPDEIAEALQMRLRNMVAI